MDIMMVVVVTEATAAAVQAGRAGPVADAPSIRKAARWSQTSFLECNHP